MTQGLLQKKYYLMSATRRTIVLIVTPAMNAPDIPMSAHPTFVLMFVCFHLLTVQLPSEKRGGMGVASPLCVVIFDVVDDFTSLL